MTFKTNLQIYAGSGNRSSLVPEIVTIHLAGGRVSVKPQVCAL